MRTQPYSPDYIYIFISACAVDISRRVLCEAPSVVDQSLEEMHGGWREHGVKRLLLGVHLTV